MFCGIRPIVVDGGNSWTGFPEAVIRDRRQWVESTSRRTHPNLALLNSMVLSRTAGYLARQESFESSLGHPGTEPIRTQFTSYGSFPGGRFIVGRGYPGATAGYPAKVIQQCRMRRKNIDLYGPNVPLD